MKNTEERIYQYLENSGPASIAQVSRHFALTRADIRHHISALLQAGRVARISSQKPAGAGRPAALFEAVAPLNPLLMKRLITGFYELLAEQGISEAVVAETLANKLLAGFHPQGSPANRLNQAVAYLTEMGIKSKWEAGASGPKIIFENPVVLGMIGPVSIQNCIIRKLQN